ncbi:MAG: DNA polymerase Y family protein, partial [Azospirillaceae bacterium]
VRLFDPPRPIEAMAPVPDDPPALFRWDGRLHRVARADGPERVGPEWWTAEPGQTRDYYRVEDTAGRRFWLFRAGLYTPDTPPRWFLHGLFP